MLWYSRVKGKFMAYEPSISILTDLPVTAANIEPLLHEGERRIAIELEDLQRLHALSLRLASNGDVAAALVDVLRTAATLVGVPLGSTQLLTPEGALGMVGQVGFGDIIIDQFGIVRIEDCSTCAVALQQRSRVIVRDLRADPQFTEIAAALRSYGVVAAVSTPLLDSVGNVMAMFSLYWQEEHEPTERELRILDLCADLAGRHVERSKAEARQRLLMHELAHRGRNLVSVIQAVAIRTLSGERTLTEARDAFVGRLQALANTYNTLTDETPEIAQLDKIVSAELKSFSERARIRGPYVVVSAKVAQTLSLVVHELATNAAKYGALSVQSGRLDVAWEIATQNDREVFLFKWSETGGPVVKPPARKGFGSVIMTSVVGSELACAPTMEYHQDGFQYQLECSLGALKAS
jgi:two-component sensor histidine kinase